MNKLSLHLYWFMPEHWPVNQTRDTFTPSTADWFFIIHFRLSDRLWESLKDPCVLSWIFDAIWCFFSSPSLSPLHLMLFFSVQRMWLELRALRCGSLGKEAWYVNLSRRHGRVLAWSFLTAIHQKSYNAKMILLQKYVSLEREAESETEMKSSETENGKRKILKRMVESEKMIQGELWSSEMIWKLSYTCINRTVGG